MPKQSPKAQLRRDSKRSTNRKKSPKATRRVNAKRVPTPRDTTPKCAPGEKLYPAYYRKPYVRKDGKHVESAFVRARCGKKPIRPKGKLAEFGYSVNASTEQRRHALNRAKGLFDPQTIKRILLFHANLRKNAPADSKQAQQGKIFREDYEWALENFPTGKRRYIATLLKEMSELGYNLRDPIAVRHRVLLKKFGQLQGMMSFLKHDLKTSDRRENNMLTKIRNDSWFSDLMILMKYNPKDKPAVRHRILKRAIHRGTLPCKRLLELLSDSKVVGPVGSLLWRTASQDAEWLRSVDFCQGQL